MKEELKAFKKFKETYQFEPKEIIEKDGIQYCDGIALVDEEGTRLGESEKWINVGYRLKGPYARGLSNLFPYSFTFRGKELASLEGFFQGIKFKDISMQNLVLTYSGLDACNIKIASDHDWQQNGTLYWQGEAMNRFSKEYEDIIDELYISAIQNPLYRNVLKKCDKPIIHSLGNENEQETVFTRYEFEKQLNCLKDFLKKNEN